MVFCCWELLFLLGSSQQPLQLLQLLQQPAYHTRYTHTPKSLQCLRLTATPNRNARHDPCPGTNLANPLSPLEMFDTAGLLLKLPLL